MNNIAFNFLGRTAYLKKAQSPAQNTASQTSDSLFYDRCFNARYKMDENRVYNLYGGCLFSGGGGGQELHMKYDESSTEADPIIRAWGIDSKGNAYERLIHVNDVDPHNATPAELKALEEHLRKTGDAVVTSSGSRLLGAITGMLSGFDVNEKVDYMQYIGEYGAHSMDKGSAMRSRLDAERYLFYYQQQSQKLQGRLGGDDEWA